MFRVVGRTDSTNLRMHWHAGELRVHDPATREQHGLKGKAILVREFRITPLA